MLCAELTAAGASRSSGSKTLVIKNAFIPNYRIQAAGGYDIGAAWKKTSREGRDYISVKLDDPNFPAPVYATLSETDTAGEYTLIWSR